MRRLLHLLWILPVLVLGAGMFLWFSARGALADREELHAGVPSTLEVRSDDFDAGGRIPTEHTCEGEGVSPHLAWSGAPPETRSFAVVETDWDAPAPSLRLVAVSHWVLYEIPPDVTEIPRAVTDARLAALGVEEGEAMGGDTGYLPSCPPAGDHAYEFVVYALDVAALEPTSGSREDVLEAMDGHVLAYGTLTGYRGPEG